MSIVSHIKKVTASHLIKKVGMVSLLVFAVASTGLYLNGSQVASAQDSPIRFSDVRLESNFPESIHFYASFETDLEIEDIRVRFSTGPGSTEQYDYLDLEERGTGLIDGELEWRVNTSARYVPPGAFVKYHFEVFAEDGNEYLSENYEGLVTDARFEWEVVTAGPIRVYYHGPVQTRAERLADAGMQSMNLMAPIIGSEIETPIVVTLYNNNAEMIGAVQARSATISRELITEGQAFHEESVVLVLSGNRDIGTLTHELTHILVGRAAGGSSALVPLWLNEGLAEYGNLDKGLSYGYFLEWAIDTGRLTPFSRLRSFPGEPNLVIVSYGQSRSMIEYLIENYGGEKIAEVIAAIADGTNSDIAIRNAYGKTVQQLDNDWRASIGADQYVPPTPTPTPDLSVAPTPAFGLLTLTPTEGGVTVGDSESDQAGTREPDPTPLPSATPLPAPTETPIPQPTETAVVAMDTSATEQDTVEESEASSSGGLCNAQPGESSPLEASSVLIAVMLGTIALLRLYRRAR